MRSLSILQNVTKKDVRLDPFPHIVVKNALPDDLYQALARSYPPRMFMGIFLVGNNRRWNYPFAKAHRNVLVPRIWREFLAYHCSGEFLGEFIALFGDAIRSTHPERFPTMDSLRSLRAGAKGMDNHETCDVLLDAQISGNTSVMKAKSPRTTHVDEGDKLFSGLLYMRQPNYRGVGGDLTISRFKPEYAGHGAAHFNGQYVDDKFTEVVETVAYAPNTLVLFVNSLNSLHGVTVRQPVWQSRIFANFIAVVRPPALYTLPKRQRNQAAAKTPERVAA